MVKMTLSFRLVSDLFVLWLVHVVEERDHYGSKWHEIVTKADVVHAEEFMYASEKFQQTRVLFRILPYFFISQKKLASWRLSNDYPILFMFKSHISFVLEFNFLTDHFQHLVFENGDSVHVIESNYCWRWCKLSDNIHKVPQRW